MDSFIIDNVNKFSDVINCIINKIDNKRQFFIGFSGELGSGKTTLIKEILAYYFIDKNEISSPTYVLQNIYKNKDLVFEHWDLYRLNNYYFNEDDSVGSNIVFIEWYKKAENFEDFIDLIVNIEIISETKRRVSIS